MQFLKFYQDPKPKAGENMDEVKIFYLEKILKLEDFWHLEAFSVKNLLSKKWLVFLHR